MRYTTIKTILILTLCYLSSYSQSPSFVNNLNFATSFVCHDGQMTLNATVANAESYQFQKRNESTNLWENISGGSGSIASSPSVVSYTFFGITENITTRLIISKNTVETISNDITISPQRPNFNFQPLDITQCNGLNAGFRLSASGTGTLTYQWQLNSGGVFQNISNGAEYSGATTPNMTVVNLANNENGKVFRCVVTDGNNCENYSNGVTLSVNQLSTTVNPTTATAFCEGQNVQFSVTTNVGQALNYDWQLRRSSDPNYISLISSERFENVNTAVLKVNGILPNERSYKLNVTYQNLLQNTDGSRSTGTCIKSAERANYTIRARPAPPTQIADVFRCGPGKISTSVVSTNSIFWYSDSTLGPIISNNLSFSSPTLTASTKYFYSLKDANQCESYKRVFEAVIRPVPSQIFEKNLSICPSENKFTLNFSSINHSPSNIYILKASPTLTDFIEINAATFSNIFDVPVPANSISGNYKFKIFSQNQHCFSDTATIDLTVKLPTTISSSPASLNICEGSQHTFDVQYQAENPSSINWYKNNNLITNQNASTLVIENISLADGGVYKAEIIGNCGTAFSTDANLEVLPKTSITKQPKNTIVCQNGNTKFTVEATGAGILNYQWKFNNVNIGTNSPELSLSNVPINYHNAIIKCIITSDCEPVVTTDEVLLLVDDLPSAPIVNNTQGFCKSIQTGTLIATSLLKHRLNWFDENNLPLTSDQINISSIYSKPFYVSQKDSNQCESPKALTQATVNEPFSLKATPDKYDICSAGLFNRSTVISCTILPDEFDKNGINFQIFRNNTLISSNLTGEFSVDTGGTYKIKATKNYCSDSSEIVIQALHTSLNISPTINAIHQVCKNSDLAISASGGFIGGNFFWYNSANSPFQFSSGNEIIIDNINSPGSYYVAYGITTNNVYCESPRANTAVQIKPDLEISATASNTSCANTNDGNVNLSVTNGQPPYTFTLKTNSNSTGFFNNLVVGNYKTTVVDAEGCTGEKDFSIAQRPGVSITQQPTDIRRCRTNIANFNIVATNYDQLVWEKKLPNSAQFEVIANESGLNLRLENIGNATNPHLSVYRAKLSKNGCVVYSNEVTLFVNSITGTASAKAICEGSNILLDLNEYTIIGENKSYQWQYRPGTSGNFLDLSSKTEEKLAIVNILNTAAGYYRCRITFDNGGGNSCVINSSTSGFKLNVDFPETPTLSGEKTICKGQSTLLSATNCSGILTWSDGKTGMTNLVNPTTTTTYTAHCNIGTCSKVSINSITITVNESPTTAPTISISKTKFCNAENIQITANNCTGQVIWSNGSSGHQLEIMVTESFNISAHCVSQNCQSPESQILHVFVYPILSPGSISSGPSKNCSGFNPPTINSLTSPSGGNIQWQKSENCTSENPTWADISGEASLTYNPPALTNSTCFRRKTSDSCQTVYSNSSFFEIVPDPVITVSADKSNICFGQKLVLNKSVIGGEGICNIQWQINKVSGAVSSAFWQNLSVTDVLEFQNANTGVDSTFYYRARIDCQNSSCNIATSNVVSATFHPELVLNTSFTDSTICAGTSITLASTGCKGQILWSKGQTLAQITVAPSESTIYTVFCKNDCQEVSKSFNISVVAGIPAPSLIISKTKFCNAENIQITASNCTGQVIWSNGSSGHQLEIMVTESFSISAHCVSQNCQSPESQILHVFVYPTLSPGTISSGSSKNCSGFNPPTINSLTSPSGGNPQWQKSENCTSENPAWADISGEADLTFNPPALITSTCFRRKTSDSCQTVYSNSIFFEILPDPVITVSADKSNVCFGQKLVLNKSVIGGEGICNIQWQINKVSGAVSSTFWQNLSVTDVLEFQNANTGVDSTFYFRARIDCQNGSCNIATSNVVSAIFHPEPVLNTAFTDSTICAGTPITLASTGCKGLILWSNGQTLAQITVAPSERTIYTVFCKNDCQEVSKSFNISVVAGIPAPFLIIPKTKFCNAENIQITANNCTGQVIWSNGSSGHLLEIMATESFNISAHCVSQNCQSPESQILHIFVYPTLSPGSISSGPSKNCSGFNPPTINSLTSPSGGNIQWQKSENCTSENPTWADISGGADLTFNPPALITSTCFRRKTSDSCQTVYSNSIFFEIVPDPVITVSADKSNICFGQKLVLNKSVIGGEGICNIQWQINKVSGAVSSTFWQNLSVTNVLEFQNANTGADSTFYYRARIDCQNSSCNIATSNVVSATFHPELVLNTSFTDSTICAGTSITLASTGCKGQILWSNGQTLAQITVAPSESTIYTVFCKNDCQEVSKSFNISVVAGIDKPINTTPASVILPSSLIFSANGQNLKWYDAEFDGNQLSQAPVVSIAGSHTYWVSQKIGLCESARLEITSILLPKLEIVAQPSSAINCFGNTTSIKLQASGSGLITYKWQRKRPTDPLFSDIENTQTSILNYTTNELKIQSSGNTESPDNTKFRCVVTDENSTITSSEIVLNINRLVGALTNQKLCIGNNLSINLNQTHQIQGIPSKIQWQQRTGTGSEWINLSDSANITGTNSLELKIQNLTLENQKQYRCSVLFNSSSGTCTETTDLMSLSINGYPQNPANIGFEFCQNENSPKIELYEPKDIEVIWYAFGSNLPSNKQPIINTKTPGNQVHYYSFRNSAECESAKAVLQVIIHPEPPKPFSTTPTQVTEGEILQFAAIGESIKWYTSRTGKTFSYVAPTHQKVGSYDYYVSQTSSKGCESERTYIESEIVTGFGITTQPINLSNCDNNTSTFSIRVKGALNPTYRWQILKNGVFTDLLGQNDSNLKIDNVGKEPYTDGSTFRCIVSNSVNELISNEVKLRVNRLEGTLIDMETCEGVPFNTEGFSKNIMGKIGLIEWQKKENDGYRTVFSGNNISDILKLDPSNSGDFRLRVTFQNQGNNTCVRTSNNFRIGINKKPEGLPNLNFKVCQYSSIQKLLNTFPENYSLKNLDSSILDIHIFDEIKKYSLLGGYSNAKGCKSEIQKINIEVESAPKIEAVDSILNYCQFSNPTKYLKFNNLNTFWYNNLEIDDFTENQFNIDDTNSSITYKWAAIEGSNGCLSQKKKIQIKVSSCFFENKIDSCIALRGKTLEPNAWNYFHDSQGQIVAAIHPNGQNLGTVNFDFLSTSQNFIEDVNRTKLFPRYYNLETSKKANLPFRIRFFGTSNEILSTNLTLEQKISIINYKGHNKDCSPSNNILNNNYWLLSNTKWQSIEIENIYYTEISTLETGEFGLWYGPEIAGRLVGKVNDKNQPDLQIEQKITNGNYSVNKSEDGKKWFVLSEKPTLGNITDTKPFVYSNYYQLIYDFGNGIKTVLNTVKVDVENKETPCFVIENPSENKDLIKLYFPNIEKNSIRLSTLWGQSLNLKKITEMKDYLHLEPLNQLSTGFYTLSAESLDGSKCHLKVWIR